MATNRNLVFVTDNVYHVYNRGVERRVLFSDTREHTRFVQTLWYYRFRKPPLRYSKFLTLNPQQQSLARAALLDSPKQVDILAYCLMPNHFHLLLRQTTDRGIHRFLSNVSDSYAKYFNTKHTRVGPLFQGSFKAVFIETEEELMHVSRYIHLNPVVSSLIEIESLAGYRWSSCAAYFHSATDEMVETAPVLSLFPSQSTYQQFIHDQADHAKKLEKLKHVAFKE